MNPMTGGDHYALFRKTPRVESDKNQFLSIQKNGLSHYVGSKKKSIIPQSDSDKLYEAPASKTFKSNPGVTSNPNETIASTDQPKLSKKKFNHTIQSANELKTARRSKRAPSSLLWNCSDESRAVIENIPIPIVEHANEKIPSRSTSPKPPRFAFTGNGKNAPKPAFIFGPEPLPPPAPATEGHRAARYCGGNADAVLPQNQVFVDPRTQPTPRPRSRRNQGEFRINADAHAQFHASDPAHNRRGYTGDLDVFSRRLRGGHGPQKGALMNNVMLSPQKAAGEEKPTTRAHKWAAPSDIGIGPTPVATPLSNLLSEKVVVTSATDIVARCKAGEQARTVTVPPTRVAVVPRTDCTRDKLFIGRETMDDSSISYRDLSHRDSSFFPATLPSKASPCLTERAKQRSQTYISNVFDTANGRPALGSCATPTPVDSSKVSACQSARSASVGSYRRRRMQVGVCV
jgi:hypothetical protein